MTVWKARDSHASVHCEVHLSKSVGQNRTETTIVTKWKALIGCEITRKVRKGAKDRGTQNFKLSKARLPAVAFLRAVCGESCGGAVGWCLFWFASSHFAEVF